MTELLAVQASLDHERRRQSLQADIASRRYRVGHGRRRAAVGAAAGAAVAATAGGGIFIGLLGGAAPASASTRIVNAISQAEASGAIFHSVMTYQLPAAPGFPAGAYRYETWSDAAHPCDSRMVGTSPSGQVISISEQRTDPANPSVTQSYLINPTAKTYSTPPTNCSSAAGQIQAALRDGLLSLRGPGMIAGQSVLRMEGDQVLKSQSPSLPTEHVKWVVWVDPQTYLPVKETTDKDGLTTVTTTNWLPSTAANVAQLWSALPSGLTVLPNHLPPSSTGG
ncbi:MAG: hypothetical protein ACRDWV_06255 [Acidimicrobiales bacterium]